MNEAVIITNLTLVLVILAKVLLEMVRNRKKPKESSDSFYPTDRKRCEKNHCNLVKLCHKSGVEPEV